MITLLELFGHCIGPAYPIHSAYFQYLSILRFTVWWSKSPQVVAYKSFLFENSDAYYSYQTCGSSNECLNEYFEMFVALGR